MKRGRSVMCTVKPLKVAMIRNGKVRNLYQPRCCMWHWNLPSCLSTTRQLLQLHSDAAPLSLPMLGPHAARHHGHQGHGVPGGSAEGRPSRRKWRGFYGGACPTGISYKSKTHTVYYLSWLSLILRYHICATLCTYWQQERLGCAIRRQNIHACVIIYS